MWKKEKQLACWDLKLTEDSQYSLLTSLGQKKLFGKQLLFLVNIRIVYLLEKRGTKTYWSYLKKKIILPGYKSLPHGTGEPKIDCRGESDDEIYKLDII